MELITPPALVMRALLDTIEEKILPMRKVYNPELVYDRGVRLLRASEGFDTLVSNSTETPVFMYNRAALRYVPGIKKRFDLKPVMSDIPLASAKEYQTSFCNLELKFLYITTDIRLIEFFEMGYIVGGGVRDIKDFELDLSDYSLPSFKYMVDWGELEEIQIGSDEHYYTGLGAIANISGNFVVRLSDLKLIKQIDLTIKSWDGYDLSFISVVPQ